MCYVLYVIFGNGHQLNMIINVTKPKVLQKTKKLSYLRCLNFLFFAVGGLSLPSFILSLKNVEVFSWSWLMVEHWDGESLSSSMESLM